MHKLRWGGAAQLERCAGKQRDAERRRKAGRKREMKLQIADTGNSVTKTNVEARTTWKC